MVNTYHIVSEFVFKLQTKSIMTWNAYFMKEIQRKEIFVPKKYFVLLLSR